MPLRPDAWLRWLDTLPPELGRSAIPADPERRANAARLMAALELPHQELYPWGLEAGHRLWEPWAAARDAVELSAGASEEPGAQADWIVHDREAGTLTLATLAPLPSRCARFSAWQCPRMAPMGHEPATELCNYWAWEGKDPAAPTSSFPGMAALRLPQVLPALPAASLRGRPGPGPQGRAAHRGLRPPRPPRSWSPSTPASPRRRRRSCSAH